MERISNIWSKLPKTLKVFIYVAISTILAEVLVELRAVEQGVIVRILAQLINLLIVFIQEAVPEVKKRLVK